MTDEATGGKPLFCDTLPFNANSQEKPKGGRVAFVGDPPLSYLMRVMAQTHTTIPTAALTELLAAAEECAEDLDGQISDRWPYADRSPEPPIIRQTVRRLRAAVARVRGE